jgi:nucleoside-diphosphate-sugar epimerase
VNHHVIVGAGPVGSGIANLLAGRGEQVTIITRSGSGPDHALITRVTADATDAAALTRAATNAATIFNCVNPPYNKWATDWPPVHTAMMTAAQTTGAVLVMMGNLYLFGEGTAMPMREGDAPTTRGTKGAVRASMETDLLAAHAAGILRATFARASDFYGPTVLNAAMGERTVPRIIAGKRVTLLGTLGAPHSLSYMPDVVTTMVTIATDERAWGKAWHVPNAPATTQRQTIDAFAEAAGTTAKVGTIPHVALSLLGIASPMMRELKETWHQWAQPWVTDSSLTEQTFGLRATPLQEGAEATVGWWRRRG